LFRLKLGQPIRQGAVPAALLDHAHDFGDGLGGVGKLAPGGFGRGAALAVEPVGFLGIGAHGFGGHFRGHHLVPQASQNSRFQRLARNGAAIVAAVG